MEISYVGQTDNRKFKFCVFISYNQTFSVMLLSGAGGVTQS